MVLYKEKSYAILKKNSRGRDSSSRVGIARQLHVMLHSMNGCSTQRSVITKKGKQVEALKMCLRKLKKS